jgi:hypothetical protein
MLIEEQKSGVEMKATPVANHALRVALNPSRGGFSAGEV